MAGTASTPLAPCESGYTRDMRTGRCLPAPISEAENLSRMLTPQSGSPSGTVQSTYQPETNTYSAPVPVTTITPPLASGRLTGDEMNAFWGTAEGQRSLAAMRGAAPTASNEERQQVANLQQQPPPAPSTGGADAIKANPVGGPVTPPSAKAGTDAALLRAKERQGQIGRSALTGLHEALGERGVLGSGLEAGATADVASASAQGLSDVNREQLIQEDDIARRLAELSYTGSIQQRGQDITARGQNLNALMGDQSQNYNAQQDWYKQQQAVLEALRQLQY